MTERSSGATLREKNRRVLEAMKSLVHPSGPEREEFRAELRIEYPIVEETEAEAKDWLEETLDHDGDQITMEVTEVERVTDE